VFWRTILLKDELNKELTQLCQTATFVTEARHIKRFHWVWLQLM